jgi:hypothetical protein
MNMTKTGILYLYIPFLLATMSGSGCKRHYSYKPEWNKGPSTVTWESLLSAEKPIVLYLGDDSYHLEEPHMEGETLVATLGKKLPPDSVGTLLSYKSFAVPKDSIPVTPDWAKPAYVYTDGMVSLRGNEVRMDDLKITGVKTYSLHKESPFWETVLGVLFLLLLIAWKILPLFL